MEAWRATDDGEALMRSGPKYYSSIVEWRSPLLQIR